MITFWVVSKSTLWSRSGRSVPTRRLLDGPHALGLARPVQPVALLAGLNPFPERALQNLEIDLPLAHSLREVLADHSQPFINR